MVGIELSMSVVICATLALSSGDNSLTITTSPSAVFEVTGVVLLKYAFIFFLEEKSNSVSIMSLYSCLNSVASVMLEKSFLDPSFMTNTKYFALRCLVVAVLGVFVTGVFAGIVAVGVDFFVIVAGENVRVGVLVVATDEGVVMLVWVDPVGVDGKVTSCGEAVIEPGVDVTFGLDSLVACAGAFVCASTGMLRLRNSRAGDGVVLGLRARFRPVAKNRLVFLVRAIPKFVYEFPCCKGTDM